jgi:hypothetical protein
VWSLGRGVRVRCGRRLGVRVQMGKSVVLGAFPYTRRAATSTGNERSKGQPAPCAANEACEMWLGELRPKTRPNSALPGRC